MWWSRLSYVVVPLFFVVMNVLLWRSEFGARSDTGSPLPAEVVWQKVLTAPDNSRMEIRHHGVKVGYGIWTPSLGEDLAIGRRMTDEPPPEGMVKTLSHYTIDFDGNLILEGLSRLRFTFNLKLSTNQDWEEFSLRLGLRPSVWEIRSIAADKTLTLTGDEGNGRTERVFKFSDLQNPEKILREFGGPLLPGTLREMGLPLNQSQSTDASVSLTWEARNDWLAIGHTRMRVYRVQAPVLDRFHIVIFVSLEGEILRVELPDEIVLVNDFLTTL